MSATDWSRITERRAHDLVWALEIGGLPYRLVSDSLPAKTLPKLAGNYTDITAIRGVGPAGGSIPLLGGRGESSTASILLSVRRASTLMGLLNRACPDDVAQARVTTYIEHSDVPATPATIELDRDPTVFGSFPRVLHIGREAIYCSASAGTAVGGGDPFRVQVGTRAVYGTQPEQHSGAEAPVAVRPFLLDGMTAWRGQRCTLYVGVRLGSGAVSTLQVYLRGVLSGPADWKNGTEATLKIVPLASKLDQKIIGPMRAVGLVPGWVVVDGERGFRVEHAQRVRAGDLWRSATDALTNAGDAVLKSAQGGSDLDDHNDFTLAEGHPRYGRVQLAAGGTGRVIEHSGVVAAGITVNGQAPGPIPENQPITNAEAIELKRAELVSPGDGPTLLRWPAEVFDTINAQWFADTRDGIDGAWASVQVANDADGLHMRVDPVQPYPTNVDIITTSTGAAWSSTAGGPEEPRVWTAAGPERRSSTAQLFHGLHLADPNDGRFPAPPGASEAERLARPAWWHTAHTTESQRVDCRGPLALAPYSGGNYIFTDGPIRVPASGSTSVVIDYYDRGTGQRASHRCRIISSTASGAGYIHQIHADDVDAVPYFADWPDVAEPVSIKPVIMTEPLPIGEAMLRLLLSGAGEQINHASYDVLPFGLNLHEDDVDIESFLAIEADPPFDRQPLILQGDETAYEAIEKMLLSANAVLTTDLRGRLTIQQVGAVSTFHARGAARYPLQGPQSPSRWRNEVVNKLELRINHDDGGLGDARGIIEGTHTASLAHYGEGEKHEIDARGVYLPGLGAAEGEALAANIIARIGALAGFYRREWAPSYGLDEAILLALGGIYTITDSEMLDYGATTPGVTNAPAVLVGLQLDGWSGKAEATFIRFPFEGGGINAGAKIVEVIDATTVEVDPSAYVPSVHPVTGADFTAAEAFPAGTVIRLMPATDWSAAVQRTVSSIDIPNQQITLTAAHGLAVGAYNGRIRPAPYGSAAGLHLELAWVGSGGSAPDVYWV